MTFKEFERNYLYAENPEDAAIGYIDIGGERWLFSTNDDYFEGKKDTIWVTSDRHGEENYAFAYTPKPDDEVGIVSFMLIETVNGCIPAIQVFQTLKGAQEEMRKCILDHFAAGTTIEDLEKRFGRDFSFGKFVAYINPTDNFDLDVDITIERVYSKGAIETVRF